MSSGFRLIAPVVVTLLAACGGEGAEHSDAPMEQGAVDSGELDIDVGPAPDGVTVTRPMLTVGDVLIALAGAAGEPTAPQRGVLRSNGPGANWELVDLPGWPAGANSTTSTQHLYWSLFTIGGEAVATASSLGTGAAPLYVWSTTDGDRWTGGLIGTFEGAGSADVHGHNGSLVTFAVDDGALVSLTSSDGAASWQQTPVAGLSPEARKYAQVHSMWTGEDDSVLALVAFPGATDRSGDHVLIASPEAAEPWAVVDGSCAEGSPNARGNCSPVVVSDGLLARGVEISLDGGTTWETPDLSPVLVDQQGAVLQGFTSLVDAPGGGWVGTIAGFIPAGGGSLAWVLRSDDAQSWTPLLGPGLDGCSDYPSDTSEPQMAAEQPLSLESGVVVSFACPGSVPGLFHIGNEQAVPLERAPQDRRFGRPLLWNDRVVVSIERFDGRIDRLLIIESATGG